MLGVKKKKFQNKVVKQEKFQNEWLKQIKLQDLGKSSRNSRMRGYKRRNFRMGGETEEIQGAGVENGKGNSRISLQTFSLRQSIFDCRTSKAQKYLPDIFAIVACSRFNFSWMGEKI